MAMRQSESSEVLDERIDEYMSMVQKAHKLEDSAFGNPTAQSASEIVAVGRIACDTADSKLSPASLLLETSRRMGAGIRVPLRVASLPAYQLFPGQIIAAKGTNASGDYFTVSEILDIPLLPSATSKPEAIEGINTRLEVSEDGSTSQPLTFLLASGPYTADDNLDFEPLKAVCRKAEELSMDTLILTGPFLDAEHPLLASGDFDLPDIKSVDPSSATMTTLFRLWISRPLQALASAIPSIVILLIPSVRDVLNRHVSWPQDLLKSKQELGLPKQARLVSNPITMSLNETIFGMSAQDVLYELRQEELVGGKTPDLLARLPRYLIEQRHFFPLFPPSNREKLPKPSGEDGLLATGASLDLGYMKLGEFVSVRPDVLITPSALPPFVKVRTLASFSFSPSTSGSVIFLFCILWVIITYDHRVWRTGFPVRSAVLKPHAGRLVVGWVTTSEYLLLYVLLFRTCFCRRCISAVTLWLCRKTWTFQTLHFPLLSIAILTVQHALAVTLTERSGRRVSPRGQSRDAVETKSSRDLRADCTATQNSDGGGKGEIRRRTQGI